MNTPPTDRVPAKVLAALAADCAGKARAK